MGLLDIVFGGNRSNSSGNGSSGGTYGDMIDSIFGPKPGKQPHNTTISSGGKIYQNRQSAIDDLKTSDVDRGICGDLGCLCPKCWHYCSDRSDLVRHLEECHKYD